MLFLTNTNEAKLVEKAREKLFKEGVVDKALLRQEIYFSWKRSLEIKIDPFQGKIENLPTTSDLQAKREENSELLNAARPCMKRLIEIVRGLDYVAWLTDDQGAILEILGNRKMCNFAESWNVVPGVNCSERNMGTTAPGICLARKIPIQVLSQEHFCSFLHNWCCSAAPIFNPEGRLIGVLDLSNVSEKLHPTELLGMVIMAAGAIEGELRFRQVHRKLKKAYHYLSAFIDEDPKSLIFLDKNGTINHINAAAAKLFGTSVDHYNGHQIETLLQNAENARGHLKKRFSQSYGQLKLNSARGLLNVRADFKPIVDQRGEQIGGVCTFELLKSQNDSSSLANYYTFDDLIYQSEVMKNLVAIAKKISMNDATVLIQGETGTGKEIIAQSIHNFSPRQLGPFIAVNCAAFPKELIESELFGYEEGSFTGAKKGGKIGLFEQANGGTIFFDEIGDMSLTAQATILRVLQEKNFAKIGSGKIIPFDVRFIAATNKNLLNEAQQGFFRMDLYYRLNVIALSVPPLRDRRQDVGLLLKHFISKHKPNITRNDDIEIKINPSAERVFSVYDWPGNIRQLENIVVSILSKLTTDSIGFKDLPPELLNAGTSGSIKTLRPLAEIEKEVVLETFYSLGKNFSKTAKTLGITRATLHRKMKEYKA